MTTYSLINIMKIKQLKKVHKVKLGEDELIRLRKAHVRESKKERKCQSGNADKL